MDRDAEAGDEKAAAAAAAAGGDPNAVAAPTAMPPTSVMTRLILIMVWRKLIRNPNTYPSLIGVIWSLVCFRWNFQMPDIVLHSISILSDAGLGMATFSLGLFMALQPRIIACGNKVNSCTGKMGKAVAEAAVSAGLQLVPVSFSAMEVPDGKIEVCDREICIHDPSESEKILPSIVKEYPDLIVIDYTVPDAVNANAELYCKLGLPFVMGTTGGNRQLLHKTVQDANNYAVISPQMGKQVVAFLAAMEIMSEKFPGAFSGYKLEVMESHQATKLDISGTAKAVISCFQKLGVSFDMNEVKQVRDPEEQVALVGVPEEHLGGHAFHMYHLTSPDGTVSFEFQHNVCGRSIYAEGTVDAAMFLYTKIKSGASKKLYDMIDVLREGNMR